MSTRTSWLAWQLFNVEREIEDAFAALVERPWKQLVPSLTAWPAVDLYETEEAYVLLADLPGVAPEDIELEVEDHSIRLCGLRWGIGYARHGRCVIVERTGGRFCRRFSLEEPVDAERIEQGVENGIYWARLPKRTAGDAGAKGD